MSKTRVLIADDSAVYRSMVRGALEETAHLEIVAAVSSGKQVIEFLRASSIDLLILDLEMPEMDGLATLREMKRLNLKCRTLVFSSLSLHGAQISMDALELGATDFVTKPGHDGAGASPQLRIKEALLPKVLALFPGAPETLQRLFPAKHLDLLQWELFRPKLIVIGSSTGGPTVLERIFSEIGGDLQCPLIIVQHMPPLFTATLAERLSKLSGIPCREARDGEPLRAGIAYVAPGDFHLRLTGSMETPVLELDRGEQIHSVRPAVDPLFQTAAALYGTRCLGFVLTGMGYDGRDGAKAIKERGGMVVIQEKSTCVVFGMAGAVYDAGACDLMTSPDEIARIIREKATLPRGVNTNGEAILARKLPC